MTQSIAITTPADEAFARAEAWITQAELQFNAQKMHTRAAALAAGNSNAITSLAESDANFSKEEAEKYLELAFQAIKDPELIANPVDAERKAQLMLRAAQAAAGLNLNQHVQTAVTNIIGNGDNLDAASVIASQQIMNVMKAAEEAATIVEQLRGHHLVGHTEHEILKVMGESHSQTSPTGWYSIYWNGISTTLCRLSPHDRKATYVKLKNIANQKGLSERIPFLVRDFSKDLGSAVHLINECFTLPGWQKLLLFNLAQMGYQFSLHVHQDVFGLQVQVYVHVPGAA